MRCGFVGAIGKEWKKRGGNYSRETGCMLKRIESIQTHFWLTLLDPMWVTGQKGSNIKKVKIIINNNFINFIFYNIKFSLKYL